MIDVEQDHEKKQKQSCADTYEKDTDSSSDPNRYDKQIARGNYERIMQTEMCGSHSALPEPHP